ncbi:MAG: 50S ribosomal protein L2 [Spirochaetota bacterium]
MGVRKYKPTSAATRYKSVLDFAEITKDTPHRSLVESINYKAGRGSQGRIAVRRKGGRVKRKYRVIDFKRSKQGVPATVKAIEYDPNRSCNIALICYKDGLYSYILAPEGLKVNDTVQSGKDVEIKTGNCLPLDVIPPGTYVHNIEMQIGKGGQMARSAGAYAVISGRDGDYVSLKLPSGEIRKIRKECKATIGTLGNKDWNLISSGKAGRSRWLGKRPKVRGVVMNPIDHPHGGGEGRTSGGRHPVSPTGLPTKGYKTRKKSKSSSKFILQGRKRNRKRGN